MIHNIEAKEAIFSSKTKWLEQEEGPTKYIFLTYQKTTTRKKKIIREVKLENGEVISNFAQVTKEIKNFYGKMYTSKIFYNNTCDLPEHNHNIHKLIEGRLSMPQLNVEDQSSIEKDLTLEELKNALTSFADNKWPGEDGFTKEFY